MQEHRDRWWDSPTVELGHVVQLALEGPFRCVHGGELPEIQVSYETWGDPTHPAVLLVHPMTADCHATGAYREQPQGWWEDLIGPGRPVDTDRHYVLCPNLVGGCYGTTGPRFDAPDGSPYFDRFPLLTPRDMMAVQRLFLEALGIDRLALVIGPSMGGMIAWEWAIGASEMVDQVVVVAAPLATTAHQIGMNWLQRRGIETDITADNEVVTRFGQMVARGVGMMSYRSPLGLEEKFGREWFKRPGSTLGERGMFNIESWLRFHGKRITKRFDPYTYLLYSRAMDLHDVSEDRGDVVAALDRVSCRVLVMGISTDHLYPPEDVHLGADILSHLGKDVRYAEIRSLHGHDAFLLETGQIGAILTQRDDAEPRRVPTRPERAQRVVRLGVLGAGEVAASFVRLVAQRRSELADRHGLLVEVRAVAEIDEHKRLDPAFDGIEVTHEPERLVARDDIDVVVELTRGTDAHPLVRAALERRRPVVTPNKPLVREHGRELERLAFRHGVRLAYHDSIAAGWPLLYALQRPLVQSEITGVRAVLSATCNVILERIEAGAELHQALAEATRRGLTETDPDLDLSAWDSAQKLSILVTRLLRRRQTLVDMERIGIEGLDHELVRAAPRAGWRIKLVAYARLDPDAPLATVRPMAVAADGHLGAIRDAHNVVVLESRTEGEIVQLGQGAGTLPVATAVLNDLIGLLDPRRSWTGRFPSAATALRAPEFGEQLTLVDREARIVELPTAGSVPLLRP